MSNQIVRTSFVLSVPDVELAAKYWCDVLGFSLQQTHGGWRFVTRDICRVMLGENPAAISPNDLGDHSYFAYIEMAHLDAYFAEITRRHASVLSPPTDKPWGMREMMVRTPDGHRVMFGQRSQANLN
jgi:uncharacterized glyoxalase superfamily protein PhnB